MSRTIKNFDLLVITEKYQTSVFYVRTSPCGLGPYTVKVSVGYFPYNTWLVITKNKIQGLKDW